MTNAAPDWPAPAPSPALRRLDVLAGTWVVDGRDLITGEAVRGDVTFAWMFGGHYLVQHVVLDYAGRPLTGVEYIAYDERDQAVRSCFFSNDGPSPFGGLALEYVWDVRDGGFTVWAAGDGRPAKFDAVFGDDRNTITGRCAWPGGGHEIAMTRADGRPCSASVFSTF